MQQDQWPQVVREEYDKPRFPRGRYVVRVGKTIVNPQPEQQLYRRSRWPFTILPYHMLPHMWQGSNAVEMSRSGQDMLNVSVSFLLQHLKMTACPQKIVEEGTLAKDKKGNVRIIKDRAGEIVVVNQGKLNNIRHLEGNRLDPSVWTLVQYLMQDLETQQFMHAVAQGKQARAGMSATEAARLDTNANDLVSLRSLLLERWIEGTGINIAQVAQENYDEGRRIRVIGWTGEVKPSQMTAGLKQVEFDLEIEPGTTLPFDEERQKQDYLMAYKLCGDPNPNPMLEEVLRKLNIANREKILLRHQQVQLFRQIVALATALKQIQQQAQAVGPNGEQVPPEQALLLQQRIVQQVMGLLVQIGQVGQPQLPQSQSQPQMQGVA